MRNLCRVLLSSFIIGFSPILLAQEKPSTGNALLPPGEENARAALNKSPRHGEWVNIYYDGKTSIRTWIVYPERKDKAPVVLLIHEIFGLSDWMRSVADQLAKEGFIAVAPDLISGFGPNGGGSCFGFQPRFCGDVDSRSLCGRNVQALGLCACVCSSASFGERGMCDCRILLGWRPGFRVRLHHARN